MGPVVADARAAPAPHHAVAHRPAAMLVGCARRRSPLVSGGLRALNPSPRPEGAALAGDRSSARPSVVVRRKHGHVCRGNAGRRSDTRQGGRPGQSAAARRTRGAVEHGRSCFVTGPSLRWRGRVRHRAHRPACSAGSAGSESGRGHGRGGHWADDRGGGRLSRDLCQSPTLHQPAVVARHGNDHARCAGTVLRLSIFLCCSSQAPTRRNRRHRGRSGRRRAGALAGLGRGTRHARRGFRRDLCATRGRC